MVRKLLAGGSSRKTRLHDELGNRVATHRLLRNGPRALGTAVARLTFGHRNVQPWISYDAQALIAQRLRVDSRVLEFGSGMSTVWYAQRAREIVSIEDHAPWFVKVQSIMQARDVRNVRLRLAADRQSYTRVTPQERGDGFDLIMIDGARRSECLTNALPLLRPGGSVYLDNSDMGPGAETGDIPAARRMLLEYAERANADVLVFTDFAPTQLFVQQGMMVTLP